MMDTPLITIVVPAYNRSGIVGRTLESIHKQTYRPLRVVLVDNNSTDGTYDRLVKWHDMVNAPDFQVSVLKQPKAGAAAARNAGLGSVDTPWVMFFDSDDEMPPDHIEDIVRYITANPKADIVGWNARLAFLDGKTAVKPFVEKNTLFNCIINGTFATQRYICRTSLIRKVGGWNENVMVWNDIELGTRLLLSSDHLTVHKIDKTPVTVNQTAESITGLNYHGNGKAREYAVKCMYDALPDKKKYIACIKLMLLAACYAKEGFKDDALRLRRQAKTMVGAAYKRMLLDAAYHYTVMGLRGAARLINPFF